MSEFNDDIESMLAAILAGEPVPEKKVEKPSPVVVPGGITQAPKEVQTALADALLSPPDPEPEEDALPSIEDILGMPEYPPKEKEPDLHACKSEAPVAQVPDADINTAQLPEIDETAWERAPKEAVQIKLPQFTTDDLMQELDIRNFGTLVSLTTMRWHAKVKDRSAAVNAAHATGADKDAYEARKRLLVGADTKLKAVHAAIDAARTEHYRMTLPWSTVGVNDHGKRSGPRLLPNTLFFEYTKMMAKFNQDMLTALNDFVAAYPSLIALAQQKLGSAFDYSEYPKPSQIRNYFGMDFEFAPIPVGQDFGNVQLQQAEKLAAAVNRRTRQSLENAMQDAWKRLLDDLNHAYKCFGNPDSKFHYTLVDKLKEHVNTLSHLNVTSDPRLENIRAKIEKNLARYDIKDIREDDALRARLAKHTKEILDLMQEYTNATKS